jgi:hypothetical protein
MTHPKSPFRDLSFYAALVPLLVALAPTSVRSWVQANPEAIAPLLLWMATHGWLRVKNQSYLSKKVDE